MPGPYSGLGLGERRRKASVASQGQGHGGVQSSFARLAGSDGGSKQTGFSV